MKVFDCWPFSFFDSLPLNRSAGAPVEHGNPPDVAPGIDWAKPPESQLSGTTHFTVADRFGNIVSCTTTVESGMGSAVVVPGRGFLLNNELTDFTELGQEFSTGRLYANRPQGGSRTRRTALGEDALTVGGKRPLSRFIKRTQKTKTKQIRSILCSLTFIPWVHKPNEKLFLGFLN